MESQPLQTLTHLFEDRFDTPLSVSRRETPPATSTPAHESEELRTARELLAHMKRSITVLERLLRPQHGLQQTTDYHTHNTASQPCMQRVVDGVFDGQCMIDAEGTRHAVPENYASKSKLVEGDLLQMMVMENGRTLYRQVERVERALLHAHVNERDGELICEAAGRCYRLSRACVNYWRVKAGDRMRIVVPKNGESAWAAIEGA